MNVGRKRSSIAKLSIHRTKTSISLLSSWTIHFQSIFVFHFSTGNTAKDNCTTEDGCTDDKNDGYDWFFEKIFPKIFIHLYSPKDRLAGITPFSAADQNTRRSFWLSLQLQTSPLGLVSFLFQKVFHHEPLTYP